MRVLVVGNGGREHALSLALHRSKSTSKIFATRPNAGMATIAESLDIAPTDVPGILAACPKHDIDLVVVGPEAPLVAGLTDQLAEIGVPALGPSAAAAQLEGSKRFAKEIMSEAGIPTAAYGAFQSSEIDAAKSFVREHGAGMVVKADGLAAGKGVLVCDTVDETLNAIDYILGDGTFGDAGAEIIVEEKLTGPELSVIALVDGETVVPFPASRDHKRAYDGDAGPNTGGMGAFSPVPQIDEHLLQQTVDEVLRPAARTLGTKGIPYQGFLYAGLMLTPKGIRVLEFNCRMGDPECQPLMARLTSDAGELFYATATGQLSEQNVTFDHRSAVCVVMTSGGYPGSYPKGLEISGLETAGKLEDVTVVHAGTRQENNVVLTNGGRVLGVTALGADIAEATQRAYEGVRCIHFEGMHTRTDIAASVL